MRRVAQHGAALARRHLGATAGLVLLALVAWARLVRPPVGWTLALGIAGMATVGFVANPRYTRRRLAPVVPTLIVVSFLVFGLMASLPGDPATNILGMTATQEEIASINEELGLDRPWYQRYGSWLGDAVVGDLGTSFSLREEVSVGIGRSLVPSLQLMGYTFLLASLIAIPLGVYAASRAGRVQDRVINSTMLGFFALPPFVLALVLVLFFSVGGVEILGYRVGADVMPAGRYVPPGDDLVEHAKHMVLPVLALALGQAAVFMRLLRADVIATLREPFIDLARAKGASNARILWRHALRPSMFTLVSVMGFAAGTLIGGALVIEIIFGLPGVGGYMFGAITQRDYVAVQGATLVIATLYITVLVAVDFLHLLLDPRLRVEG